MKCAACHEALEQKHGEIELRIHGKLFLVENVSYYECPTCGERTLSPDVSQCLFEKITKKEYEEKPVTVPVVDGCSTTAAGSL